MHYTVLTRPFLELQFCESLVYFDRGHANDQALDQISLFNEQSTDRSRKFVSGCSNVVV